MRICFANSVEMFLRARPIAMPPVRQASDGKRDLERNKKGRQGKTDKGAGLRTTRHGVPMSHVTVSLFFILSFFLFPIVQSCLDLGDLSGSTVPAAAAINAHLADLTPGPHSQHSFRL